MKEDNNLVEYGIHTEESDVRAHVSVVHKNIYVFQTEAGIEAIKKHTPREATATQPGVDGLVTAEGWLVKLEWIEDLRVLKYHSWPQWGFFSPDMTTSEKGDLAVRCVLDCIKIGRFPFWIDADEEDRENVQIKGVDVVVFCDKKIQVKCDWRSGPKPQGTGNLFLQKAECNPLRLI